MSDHALLVLIACAAVTGALAAIFVANQAERIRELIEDWQIEQSRAARGALGDTDQDED